MANMFEADKAETASSHYHRNSRSALLWCLALSLVLHVVLLAALPGSLETRGTFKVRVMDVVLMPAAPAPDPVPVPAPQRPAYESAQINKAPARREPVTEPLPAADAMPVKPREIRTAEPASVSEPNAAAGMPAKPEGEHTAISRKPQDAAAGRIAGDVTAPSFNAAYLRNPAPRYPIIARRNGEQGTVMLKVLVTREGAPGSVSVDKSSGSAHLDNAAVETVRSWRFTPARQGSQPMEAWVLVPIVFRLEPAS